MNNTDYLYGLSSFYFNAIKMKNDNYFFQPIIHIRKRLLILKRRLKLNKRGSKIDSWISIKE